MYPSAPLKPIVSFPSGARYVIGFEFPSLIRELQLCMV
jgi:hypothetical protein